MLYPLSYRGVATLYHEAWYDSAHMGGSFDLKSGAKMPMLGFGTSQLRGDTCVRAIQDALSIGYRHIDTADMYGNHREVGEGIRAAGVPREEIFVTTKVGRDHLGAQDVREQSARFLEELGLSYIDLLLIHWPNASIPLSETLGAMEELRGEGMVRAIGVSNFTEHHLEDARAAGFSIDANQVEVHPSFNQSHLRAYCREHGIAVIAYAPLGRGSDLQSRLLQQVAEKYGVSTAQISLAWLMTRGVAVIPRSQRREHIEDSFQAQELQLAEEDLAAIDDMEQGERIFAPSFNEFDY